MDAILRRQLGQKAGPRMQRIVVSLLKGGVAKSGTAVSLAHGLALAGQRVLLVDTDVQAQCNDMLGVKPQRGLAEVIAGFADPLETLCEARENLWLLAGGNELAAVKMEIARREMAPEAVLAEALEHYEGGFDYLVMDTAPGWDTLLVNALYCSEHVLSPVSMEPVALSGLMRFEERLAIIKKYNKALNLRWIVPTFVDGRVKKTGEIMAQLEERYGPRLGPPIKYSVKLSEAPAFGRTIYEHDPKGQAAEGYRALTERVLADCPPAAEQRLPSLAAPAEGAAALPAQPAAPAAPRLTVRILEPVEPVAPLAPAPPEPEPPAWATSQPPPDPLGPEPPALTASPAAAPGLPRLPRLGLRQRLGLGPEPPAGELDHSWRQVRERLVKDGRA
ncbi:MAG: ParA family protein [Thermodesulfobacteriota bacterium]